MKKIISLLTALSVLLPVMPTAFAEDTAAAVAVDTSEYKIIESEQIFFEDFEGDKLDSNYFPTNLFMTEQSSNGTTALRIRGLGQNIATNRFGPELDNYLVEADIKTSGCNASTNGGFFVYDCTAGPSTCDHAFIRRYSFKGVSSPSSRHIARTSSAIDFVSPLLIFCFVWTRRAVSVLHPACFQTRPADSCILLILVI